MNFFPSMKICAKVCSQEMGRKSGMKLGLLSSFQVESCISNAKFNLLSPQKKILNFWSTGQPCAKYNLISLYPEICVFDGQTGHLSLPITLQIRLTCTLHCAHQHKKMPFWKIFKKNRHFSYVTVIKLFIYWLEY